MERDDDIAKVGRTLIGMDEQYSNVYVCLN